LNILLVSTYALGHQPLALAQAQAALRVAGYAPTVVDTAKVELDARAVSQADVVAISVPMHTALRLALALARVVRVQRPDVVIALFGLYAPLNAEHILASGGDLALGPEDSAVLVELCRAIDRGDRRDVAVNMARLAVTERGLKPQRAGNHEIDRRGLLPLQRYAKLAVDGDQVNVAHVEASRGCKHTCRHCPITPVYQGRFFAVPQDVVLDDIDAQVRAGARHVTFGDPDFLNGPTHALKIARELHARHKDVTWDATIKVEHVLQHRHLLKEMRALGALFVVSAVESLSDVVLGHLKKDHTAHDIRTARHALRDAGIALRPTFVAFTPWTTALDYVAMCDFLVEEDLLDALDPVQLAVRLLIPPHSAILEVAHGEPWLGPLDLASLSFTWTHPDARMDAWAKEIAALAEASADQSADNDADGALPVADMIALARERLAGRKAPAPTLPLRARVPRLTEPWFCCSEPTGAQLALVQRTQA